MSCVWSSSRSCSGPASASSARPVTRSLCASGLVLLFARPYIPGQRVRIRSGALGGPFEGVIIGSGLMYTTIETPEGLVSLPNSGLLAAAIGPAPTPEPADQGRPEADPVDT